MTLKKIAESITFLMMMLPLFACGKSLDDGKKGTDDGTDDGKDDTEITEGWDWPEAQLIRRSRIAWDQSTLVKVFQPGNYARVIDTGNGNLIAVAGAVSGGVGMSRSTDYGATWSAATVIAPTPNTNMTKMSVPEIMKCRNGNLLLTYNPRPEAGSDRDTYKYGIRARISEDNGATWSDEIFVYDAGATGENGCWEPNTIELPDGEIHCYFANEYDYPGNNDQNISLCRSTDGGRTWSEREIVSYRSGHRDGMPVALYMEDTDEIIVAIEDNGWYDNRMQPAIVRTSDNWNDGMVNASSSRREYALAEKLPKEDNAAAPYICKASTGEIILSYQGTEGRDVPMQGNGVKSIDFTQEMFVAVGDESGRGFTNKTTPFNLPLGPEPGDKSGYQGMWNSIASLSDGTLYALSSLGTNGTVSADKAKRGVWGIKGYLLNDIYPQKRDVKIDADTSDWAGDTPAMATAHKLASRLYCHIAKNETGLEVLFKARTNTVAATSDVNDIRDGFEFVIAGDEPDTEVRLSVPFEGSVWVNGSLRLPEDFDYMKNTDGNNFVFECSIPKTFFDELGLEGLLRTNMVLYDSGENGTDSESVANTNTENADTWLGLYL